MSASAAAVTSIAVNGTTHVQFTVVGQYPTTLYVIDGRNGCGGVYSIAGNSGQPGEAIKAAVWDEVKQHFRPEFLNRIDETVVFHALDQANIESIARIQLKALEARLAKMDMQLEVSPAALAEIAKAGFDPVFGARPLKRAIQQRIENPLSKLILEGRFAPKDTIRVKVDPVRSPGEFQFEKG